MPITIFLETATNNFDYAKLHIKENSAFPGHPKGGAKASATLYSLIETARAFSLEPYRNLDFLYEKLL